MFGERGQLETGHFKMFQGRRDISVIWETGHSILWEKGNFILWETGNSILWESDHLSSGKHTLGIGNFGDGFKPSRV